MQKYTFVVHSPFPEHIAGRCIGYTPTGGPANTPTGTDGGIALGGPYRPQGARDSRALASAFEQLGRPAKGSPKYCPSPSTSVSSLRAAQSSSARARTPRTRKTTRICERRRIRGHIQRVGFGGYPFRCRFGFAERPLPASVDRRAPRLIPEPQRVLPPPVRTVSLYARMTRKSALEQGGTTSLRKRDIPRLGPRLRQRGFGALHPVPVSRRRLAGSRGSPC